MGKICKRCIAWRTRRWSSIEEDKIIDRGIGLALLFDTKKSDEYEVIL